MRPTLLNFRSPKERTPAPNKPMVTRDGSTLRLAQTPKSSIGNGKRFRQYKINAKRTGHMVGPGSYRDDQKSISNKTFSGGPIFAPFHKVNMKHNDSYSYVGMCMVHDPDAPRTPKRYSRTPSRSMKSDFIFRNKSNLNRSLHNVRSTSRDMTSFDTMETPPKKTKTVRLNSANDFWNSPYMS